MPTILLAVGSFVEVKRSQKLGGNVCTCMVLVLEVIVDVTLSVLVDGKEVFVDVTFSVLEYSGETLLDVKVSDNFVIVCPVVLVELRSLIEVVDSLLVLNKIVVG